MGKNKGARITITLECIPDPSSKVQSRCNGTCRYTSSKNRRNTPQRLELKKFCHKCNCHTVFKEIK
uniref:Large ribosomal subunit protein bL33c n=1 Tax=Dichotomaria marginata TaxID=268567 RepID=A0A1G4NSE8_9FLOR|nr:Ribosomal protein L33 [Dichotomaria marginata]SCW21554.1 Ribosomal protein L33 [Dichotomaria marginata]